MPNGPYRVIMADPAWPYTGAPDKMGAAGNHYEMMSWDHLKAMPVREELAHPDGAVCLMWATGPWLDQQIDVLKAWGFHFRGVAFVWVKTAKDGRIIHGQGVRPTFVKPTTELLLLGSTRKAGRAFPLASEATGQVVLAAREGHSVKPQIFRDKILEVSGDVSRIELFARRRVEGWDSTGIELDGSDYRLPGMLAPR